VLGEFILFSGFVLVPVPGVALFKLDLELGGKLKVTRDTIVCKRTPAYLLLSGGKVMLTREDFLHTVQ
jgi:hypothetical protein